MKKLIAVLLCLFLLTAFVSCATVNNTDEPDDTMPDSGNGGGAGDDTSAGTGNDTSAGTGNEPVGEPTLDLEDVTPIKDFSLIEDDRYTIAGGDVLTSYFEEPLDTFLGVCKDYMQSGWDLYGYTVKNGNHFATWTRGSRLVHLYWIACENEFNKVASENGADTLPPKEPTVTTGSCTTSVTQLRSSANNGMGYITRLADGSFIIHDGGHDHCAGDLWNTLVELNGGTEGIVIRAWIITHSHGDHYAAFRAFAPLYAADVTLETVMISPVESSETYFTAAGGIAADVAEFEGAELCYVHTGMTFQFCNVKLEVLFTGDELWIAEPTRDEGLGEAQNPNNASIVSRIYTDDYSALFLADASEEVGLRLALYYGNYLKSDMCQVAHHGVEDFPLIAYRFINSAILWYPCDTALYNRTGRDKEVRDALADSAYTKEIIIRDFNTVTRNFGLYGE